MNGPNVFGQYLEDKDPFLEIETNASYDTETWAT